MTDSIAIVRLRGIANIKPKVKKTLELLRLNKPNSCVVMASTPQNMGMVMVVKDYVAYGKVGDTTVEALVSKRGEKGKGGKSVFRLHPPKKGLKDLKLHWPEGSLGKRDDMDTFLKKMI